MEVEELSFGIPPIDSWSQPEPEVLEPLGDPDDEIEPIEPEGDEDAGKDDPSDG